MTLRTTWRSAAKTSPEQTVDPSVTIAKMADSILRNMTRILVFPPDESAAKLASLLENHADPVLLGPDNAAVAHHAVLLGHQLKAGGDEHRVGHVDCGTLGGD